MLDVNNRYVALYPNIRAICKCRDKGDAAIKNGKLEPSSKKDVFLLSCFNLKFLTMF